MGEIETVVKKRLKKNRLQGIILSTVGAVGRLSIAVLAPNVFQAMHKFGVRPHKRQKEVISTARKRLLSAGLLKYAGGYLCLTPKGEAKLDLLELYDYQITKPKRWDKKWRVLIFDIPEYRKSIRDKVRRTLMMIGFIRLQDSVWVYPYPCDDMVALLKAEFKIGKDLLYLVVESIENDAKLTKEFNLPLQR